MAASAAQIQHVFRPVTAEEYDREWARCPDACRPFARELGDHRTGAELLSSHALDLAQPLTAMRAAPEGRRRLGLLADAVRRRIEPVVAAAAARLAPEA